MHFTLYCLHCTDDAFSTLCNQQLNANITEDMQFFLKYITYSRCCLELTSLFNADATRRGQIFFRNGLRSNNKNRTIFTACMYRVKMSAKPIKTTDRYTYELKSNSVEPRINSLQ
jgi:hypothetical protein